ncbi:MAG: LysR family transcriptional regulator [Pseudomonadota bacterium]
MRLRQIEVFHAIYTAGSITAAAESLSVSQPAVSKVLAHAEQQLGFQLFERRRGRLIATPEAGRLFPHVEQLYARLAEVRRVAANLRDSAEGRVRLACTPALGLELVPRLVAAYLDDHPGVVFELETLHHAEIAAAIHEGRIDIGLAFQSPDVSGVRQETLADSAFVLIAPPTIELATGDPFDLRGLADLPFVALHQRSPLGALVQARFDALQLRPRVVAVAETYQVARALVANGVGVSLVDGVTARSTATAAVQTRSTTPRIEHAISLLSHPEAPLSRVCEQFVDRLRRTLPAEIG